MEKEPLGMGYFFQGAKMITDVYSTSELIDALEYEADHLPTDDMSRALMRAASNRLHQYQWMDMQRVIDALRTVKKSARG